MAIQGSAQPSPFRGLFPVMEVDSNMLHVVINEIFEAELWVASSSATVGEFTVKQGLWYSAFIPSADIA